MDKVQPTSRNLEGFPVWQEISRVLIMAAGVEVGQLALGRGGGDPLDHLNARGAKTHADRPLLMLLQGVWRMAATTSTFGRRSTKIAYEAAGHRAGQGCRSLAVSPKSMACTCRPVPSVLPRPPSPPAGRVDSYHGIPSSGWRGARPRRSAAPVQAWPIQCRLFRAEQRSN